VACAVPLIPGGPLSLELRLSDEDPANGRVCSAGVALADRSWGQIQSTRANGLTTPTRAREPGSLVWFGLVNNGGWH
jgi:hypothetical protein